MRTIQTIFLCALVMLATTKYSVAKEWRGISPLRSTLADVERQFGACTSKEKYTCTYAWKNERVTFVFLSEPCGTGKQKLPRRTIVRIERRPSVPTSLPEYHKIDPYHYTAFRPRHDTEEFFENYVDDEEGFAAESRQHVVTQVYYTAKAKEISLCPGSSVKASDLLPHYNDAIVWEFFCPTIAASCPDKTVEPDAPITFSGSWSGGFPYMEPTYNWTVSAGKIMAGQGTPTIRVDTKGLPDDTELTATFTVGGIPVSCSRSASCTTKIHPYRVRVQDESRQSNEKRSMTSSRSGPFCGSCGSAAAQCGKALPYR